MTLFDEPCAIYNVSIFVPFLRYYCFISVTQLHYGPEKSSSFVTSARTTP